MFFSAEKRDMREQPCFPGFEPQPFNGRLFFGLLSPAHSATAIIRAADDLRHRHGLTAA
jgi:hypothetical protein